MNNFLRTIIKLIICLVLLFITGFIINVAPNYVIEESKEKVGFIYDNKYYNNELEFDLINKDGVIYMSTKDIAKYLDDNVYYENTADAILTGSDKVIACMPLNENNITINNMDAQISSPAIRISARLNKDGTMQDQYFLPVSEMGKIYNADITYYKESNNLVIDPLEKSLVVAEITTNEKVPYKASIFSTNIDEVKAGDKLVVVTDEDGKEVKVNGYTRVRTPNGYLGYFKNLPTTKIEREGAKESKSEPISLVWDYFSEYGHAPARTEHINGINVVSPTFITLKDEDEGDLGGIFENVGEYGEYYIYWAKQNGYKIWPMLSNNSLEITTEKAISNYKTRTYLIDNIIKFASKYDVDGINLDFENIDPNYAGYFTRFVIECSARLKAIDKTVSIDITCPDGGDKWSNFFERNEIGKVVDYVCLMAYDQHNAQSTNPGTTAGVDWIEVALKKMSEPQSINYVESNKIILGIPLYSWVYVANQNGGYDAQAIAMNAIGGIVANGTSKWEDDEKQYKVESNYNGSACVTWIEEEKSINAKLDLIKKYKLNGAAFWQKDQEANYVWSLVSDALGVK